MIDSEYNIDTYKSGKVNIGTVMENSEMLMTQIILKLKKSVSMWLKNCVF